MKSMLFMDFGCGCIYEPIFTEEEHYAAIKEHYNIIYDDDPEEACRQFNVRRLYDEGFNPFYMSEDYIEEYGAYGTKWWEQRHEDLWWKHEDL